MESLKLLIAVAIIVQVIACKHNASEICKSYDGSEFLCINDCRCGACGDKCLPSTQQGDPALGFVCPKDQWLTNTRSLVCAIQDEAIGPILTALFSILIVTAVVMSIIALLLICGHYCKYVTRNMSPVDIFNFNNSDDT